MAAPASSPPTHTVRVTALSGEPLVELPAALAGFSVSDLVKHLPALLPGRTYQLALGSEVLETGQSLGELPAADGELHLTGVVTMEDNAQQSMDMALIEAAKALDAERVGALLAAGASAAFVQDPGGAWGSKDIKSALHMALEGRGDQKRGVRFQVVSALIAARADVNATRSQSDWRGCGSSKSAFEMAMADIMQDVGLLQTFLDAGADPNTKSSRTVHSMRTDGFSETYLLHQAVQQGNFQVVRALLDAGADVDALSVEDFRNERGFHRHLKESGLHIACRQGNASMAALLLHRGAQVDRVREDLVQEEVQPSKHATTDNPRDPNFESTVRCVPVQETALHLAIAGKDAALVSFLVCAGADAARPRLYGGAPTSPEELCGADMDLLDALRAEWSTVPRDRFEEESHPMAEEVIARALRKSA